MRIRSAAIRALGCLWLGTISPAVFGKAFIGVAVGDSDTDAQCQVPEWSSSCKSETDGYEAFGGFQFNDYFALEASYVDYGRLVVIPLLAVGFAPDGHATSITAKGIVPLSERFSLFGKAGMSRWELESGGFDSDRARPQNGTDPTLAVGVDFIIDVFGVRAQFSRTDFGGLDVEFASLGFMLRF
jgi:hypothetical protein